MILAMTLPMNCWQGSSVEFPGNKKFLFFEDVLLNVVCKEKYELCTVYFSKLCDAFVAYKLSLRLTTRNE